MRVLIVPHSFLDFSFLGGFWLLIAYLYYCSVEVFLFSPNDSHSDHGGVRPEWASQEASCQTRAAGGPPWTSVKHPARLEKLEVHLGLSLSRWGSHRLEGPVGVMLCQPRGRASVVRVQPLLSPFSASLLQEGAVASALGSGHLSQWCLVCG